MYSTDKTEKTKPNNRLTNGKFAPGNCANPGGRPKNAETDLLRAALDKEGKRRGVTFWRQVAKYAFYDKNVMIAVIKKFVADKNSMELEGKGIGSYTQIFEGIDEEGLRSVISLCRKNLGYEESSIAPQ